jgi:hypothetical protein
MPKPKTPDARISSCSTEIAKSLAKNNCSIYGEAQIVNASRLRMWFLRRLAAGHVNVDVKLKDNP